MGSKIGLIVLDNCKKLGDSINEHLTKENKYNNNYIIKKEEVRFNNGEGKFVIKETIREKMVFILSDVGNHSCTYKMFGYDNHMGPDEHFQDIKRVISAIGGNASKIVVIMPLLYASRQHKKKSRESLDCAIALQELERLGVDTIITFDAHDPNVRNAIPCLSFENFYATHIMLDKFIDKEPINLSNLQVVGPDAGAMDRARYYANMLKCDVGMFSKRRDLEVVIDGKNPIIAHEYIGTDVKGKDIIVVDDMIASGESIFDVVNELKKREAKNIYCFSTFAFFTKGLDAFDKAFNENKITKIYTTNLSYISEEAKNKKWLEIADCSEHISNIIYTLNKQQSLESLHNGKEKILQKINNINNK
jgi:ribose-phosphate pyrophosphokinase